MLRIFTAGRESVRVLRPKKSERKNALIFGKSERLKKKKMIFVRRTKNVVMSLTQKSVYAREKVRYNRGGLLSKTSLYKTAPLLIICPTVRVIASSLCQ